MEPSVIINGHTYVMVQTGNRHVVVVDRGWIFAGDLTEAAGRIRLDNAVMVLRWEGIGFDGMVADPASSKVTLKKMPAPVDLPEGAELFRIPVPANWGL
jgi:hypothetical protein